MTGLRVWRVRLDRLPAGRRALPLSPEELARADRFADPAERGRYVVAHTALRTVLARLTGTPAAGLTFAKEANGRPYTPGGPDFNLSHSGEWGLIAVAPPGRRVGVDVERHDAGLDFLEFARRTYRPAEHELLAALGGEAAREEFYRLWTAKEACVKATGLGLAALRELEIKKEGNATVGVSRSLPGPVPVRFLSVAPGYSAALVTISS